MITDIEITDKNIENTDYTKWRQDKFEDMSLEEIGQAAADYAKAHPFGGKAKTVL